jgi:AI-2 transport protein TqsA
VVVAYSVINLVIQSLIQPTFVGDAVGLSVTLTFLSLVFWTFVIGPLGALLAVPSACSQGAPGGRQPRQPLA